ncbi:MAG: hypothetical protein M1358_06805, partial [Chloroflexi bacterium]|nr:hypothetical protein [Chloroflexota bacterium]
MQLYAKDWRIYLGVAAVVQVPLGILVAIALSAAGLDRLTLAIATNPYLVRGAFPTLGLLTLIVALNVLLTVSAVYGSIIRAVHERFSGVSPTISSAMFFGWKKFLDLLWASLLAGLGLSLLSLLFLTLVGALIALPAMVFLATRWLYFPQVILIDGCGAITSLRRSSKLVKGLFWRSLGIASLPLATTS